MKTKNTRPMLPLLRASWPRTDSRSPSRIAGRMQPCRLPRHRLSIREYIHGHRHIQLQNLGREVSRLYAVADDPNCVITRWLGAGLRLSSAKATALWERGSDAHPVLVAGHLWPSDLLPVLEKRLVSQYSEHEGKWTTVISVPVRLKTAHPRWHYTLLLPGRWTSGRRLRAVMRTLSLQAYQALLIARQVSQARRSTESLEVINGVASSIAAHLSLVSLFATMYQQIGKVMSADVFFVALYNAERADVHVPYVYEGGVVLPPFTVPLNEGPTSSTIKTGKAQLFNRPTTSIQGVVRFGNTDRAAQSVMIAPIVLHATTIGALSVQSYEIGKYGSDDLGMLSTLAEHAAIAIENARLYERTAEQARTDFLTGLLNRDAFMQELDIRLQASSAQDRVSCLLMFDSDGLKEINDCHGHGAGDTLIRHMSEVIVKSVRDTDLICRQGGDEYLLFLEGRNETEALVTADRILSVFRESSCEYLGQQLRATCSAGIASFPAHGNSPTDLLRAVDRALYYAKGLGKDKVCVADKEVSLCTE